MTELTKVNGVGPSLASTLIEHGITDAEALAATAPEQLLTVPGIGASRGAALVQAAQDAVKSEGGAAPQSDVPATADQPADEALSIGAKIVKAAKRLRVKAEASAKKAAKKAKEKMKALEKKAKAKEKQAQKKAKDKAADTKTKIKAKSADKAPQAAAKKSAGKKVSAKESKNGKKSAKGKKAPTA